MTDRDSLTAARLDLHWAGRILSAGADATVKSEADDSHSNLGWDVGQQALTCRAGAHIHVPTFTLHHGEEVFKLGGSSLEAGKRWLGERLGASLSLREYDAPAEPRDASESFAPDMAALKRVAEWFSFATRAMSEMGELRIWPHHFDLGYFQDKGHGGKSIGGGFAVGDEHYASPYFYVNPYGIDRPDALPGLEHGFWTDKWFGAVLTVEAFEGSNGDDVAARFISDAMAKSHGVLSLPPSA